MTKCSVFETNQFIKDLKDNFSGQKDRIITKLNTFVYPQLQENPFFGKNIKKLVDYQPDTWRYHIGKYRFFYEIDQNKKIIFMIAADNRKNAY